MIRWAKKIGVFLLVASVLLLWIMPAASMDDGATGIAALLVALCLAASVGNCPAAERDRGFSVLPPRGGSSAPPAPWRPE